MHSLSCWLLVSNNNCISYCLHWYNLLFGKCHILHNLPSWISLPFKIYSPNPLLYRSILLVRWRNLHKLSGWLKMCFHLG